MTPSLLKLPAGCAFKARCPIAIDKCHEMPALEAIARTSSRAAGGQLHRSRGFTQAALGSNGCRLKATVRTHFHTI